MDFPARAVSTQPARSIFPAMFQYQKSGRYFGQLSDELTDAAAAELAELGATEIKPTYRGLYFAADKSVLYRTVYASRLLSHVLAPLKTFDCHSTKYLHATALAMPWSDLFSTEETFAITATVSNSAITHSRYAALCLKDAIADHFRGINGKRPDVDTDNPDIRFNLHVENNHASISLDAGGASLHRRGYRLASVEAPMQETLAAAIVRLSGWQGEVPLYDPMCGSGTLLCEACMHYCCIPAGFLRSRFGFEHLPDFDSIVWRSVKLEADRRIRPLPVGLIGGSDQDRGAVSAARKNRLRLPGGEAIQVDMRDFQSIPNLENKVIVCNPPYGIRMEKGRNLSGFYATFGDYLKQHCRESSAYIYFGEREYIKSIGLKTAWKKPLTNGGLDGRLVKIALY
jgi:putative N6-adenine-specific DNA methylase